MTVGWTSPGSIGLGPPVPRKSGGPLLSRWSMCVLGVGGGAAAWGDMVARAGQGVAKHWSGGWDAGLARNCGPRGTACSLL